MAKGNSSEQVWNITYVTGEIDLNFCPASAANFRLFERPIFALISNQHLATIKEFSIFRQMICLTVLAYLGSSAGSIHKFKYSSIQREHIIREVVW